MLASNAFERLDIEGNGRLSIFTSTSTALLLAWVVIYFACLLSCVDV